MNKKRQRITRKDDTFHLRITSELKARFNAALDYSVETGTDVLTEAIQEYVRKVEREQREAQAARS